LRRQNRAYPWLRLWPTVFLTAVTLAVAGCDQPWGDRPIAQPAAVAPVVAAAGGKRHATKDLVSLDAGCPLGSVALLGLNLAEKGCNSSARTRPAGPVGSPNVP
jgi:hypothetical protein